MTDKARQSDDGQELSDSKHELPMNKPVNTPAIQGGGRGGIQSQSSTPATQPYHKLKHIDLDQLIERYSNGETLPALATELGCAKSALSYALRKHNPEAWADTKEAHYECLLDDGLESVRAAEQDLNLARAREAWLRRVEWRAATEHPRWQQKPGTAVQINGSGQIQVNVIESFPVAADKLPYKEQSGDADPSVIKDIV